MVGKITKATNVLNRATIFSLAGSPSSSSGGSGDPDPLLLSFCEEEEEEEEEIHLMNEGDLSNARISSLEILKEDFATADDPGLALGTGTLLLPHDENEDAKDLFQEYWSKSCQCWC